VTVDQVSPRYIEALLGYEDRWFWHHPGINPFAFLRATAQAAWHGRIVSGGSTLTMQVARLIEPIPHSAFGKLRRLWTAYLALGGTGATLLLGVAAMIEMVYHVQLNAALGPQMNFLGATLDTARADTWFGAVFVLLTGAGLFELARRVFVHEWGETQAEIEKEIKRREAL
jgi:hypothetical protein